MTIEAMNEKDIEKAKRVTSARKAPVTEFVADIVRPSLEKVHVGKFVTMKLIFDSLLKSGELTKIDKTHFEPKDTEKYTKSMSYSTIWWRTREHLKELYKEKKKGLWERV